LEHFVLPSEKQIKSMITYFDADENCKVVMSALIDSSVKKMGPIIHTQGGSKKKPLKRGGVGFFETRLVKVSNAIVNRAKMRARNRKTTSSSQSSSFIQDPDVPSEQQLSDMNTLEIFNDDPPEINDWYIKRVWSHK
jgi:hypothetical protein